MSGHSLSAVLLAQGAADKLGQGLKQAADAAVLPQGKSLPELIGTAVGGLLSMIAVLFFGLMLYGGFLWMTARGNEQQTTKAKDTIIAAVIGMLVVISAYAVTNFVLESTKETATQQVYSGTGQCVTRQSTCTSKNKEQCEQDSTCGWTSYEGCVVERAVGKPCSLFDNDESSCLQDGYCEFNKSI